MGELRQKTRLEMWSSSLSKFLARGAALSLVLVALAGLVLVRAYRSSSALDGRLDASDVATIELEHEPAAEPATSATPDLDAVMSQLMPSSEHVRLMWNAREVLIGRCMTAQGIDWSPRPSTGAAADWDEWQEWYNSTVAANPAVPVALLGSGADGGNSGGCQLDAYLALHREGLTAEARAADLYNEAAAVALGVTANDPQEAALEVQAALSDWWSLNSARIAELAADVATEAASAKEVLGGG